MTNTIYQGNNLDVLRSLPSKSVNLVATDPPFNSGRDYTAKDETEAKGAKFKDRKWTLEDVDKDFSITKEFNPKLNSFMDFMLVNSNESLYCFMAFLASRVNELHRILKDDGAMYLHCDESTSHYVKIMMDCIFGEDNFKNNVIWHYENKMRSKLRRNWSRGTDDILYYVKDNANYTFNHQYHKLDKPRLVRKIQFKNGKVEGVKDEQGKQIFIENNDSMLDNVMRIPILATNSEKTGYPTQKPLTLYEILISASSNEGEIVLDPFCGSGTTLIASDKLKRQYIGIDESIAAIETVKRRFHDEIGIFSNAKIEVFDNAK